MAAVKVSSRGHIQHIEGYNCHGVISRIGPRHWLEIISRLIKDQSRSIIYLSDMSGFEFLLELAQGVRQPKVPVIILTRVACLTLADIAEAFGAQWFLGKGADKALVPIIRNAMVSVKPRVPRLREISPPEEVAY